MPRFRQALVATATAALATSVLTATAQTAEAAPTVRVTALNFKVRIGPTGAQTCNIVGDLYVPLDRHGQEAGAGDPDDQRIRRVQG
ncbi:hypothetical protein [Aeromicrobium sp. UC242_57]|uniref:hypothetical protein n=1 Tax=Aeromicrobium sp. UC242_57 TaxID=3374624 RepID=UPI00379AA765